MSVVSSPVYKLALLVLSLLPTIISLAGCSSAADDSSGAEKPNLAPTAVATVDTNEVAKRATVTLNGSRSFDPNGDSLRFVWTQLSGTPITITDPTASLTTFTAPTRPDTLRFSLVVSDADDLQSNEAIVAISVINHDPTADAGGNQRAAFDTIFTLDGRSSTDIDNDALDFEWTYLGSSPNNIADIPISNRFSPTTTFTVPSTQNEVLQFKLKVTDEDNAFSEQQFTITVASRYAVANAGPDQLGVTASSIVHLDGGQSYDPEQQSLAYIWTQIRGSIVSLDNPASATPSFQVPASLDEPFLEFQLRVDDGDTISPADTVAVSVLNYAGRNIESKQNPFRYSVDWQNSRNPPNVQGIAVSGNRAFVSDSTYGLHVVDFSDLSNLRLSGGYDITTGSTGGIALSDNYAFIAARTDGIIILDISSPDNPSLVTTYRTAGASANNIQIVGDYAYVANGTAGLRILDITNPTLPTQAGIVDTPSNAYDVRVVGTNAYIADNTSLQIADISNASAPRLIGSFTTASTVSKVHVENSRAYLPVYQNGLEIVDVSVSPPVSVGNYTAYAGSYLINYTGIFIANGIGYLGSSSGLEVVDFSNVNSISRISAYPTSWWTQPIALENDKIFLGDNGGLRILKLSTISVPPNFENYTAGIDLISDLESTPGNVYIAHRSGLEIFNKSTKTLSHYNTTGAAAALQAVNDEVFVLNSLPDMSLEIIDGTQVPARQIGLYDLPDASYGVGGITPASLQIVNNTAYLADYNNGLSTVNVIDRANPTILANYPINFYPYSMGVTSTSLHIGSTQSSYYFDLGIPSSPNFVSSQSTLNTIWGAKFENVFGYLAVGQYGVYEDGGLEIVTVDALNQLVTVGKLETPGWAYDIEKAGNLTYIADAHAQRVGSWSGLRVIDTSYVTVPSLVASYSTSDVYDLRAVTVTDSTAYVGSYTNGLFAIPATTLNMSKNYQPSDLTPGNTISYNINWDNYGTTVDIACKVSSGACNITSIDTANSTATVNWTLPGTTNGINHKLVTAVGNWHFFVSAQDLVNL